MKRLSVMLLCLVALGSAACDNDADLGNDGAAGSGTPGGQQGGSGVCSATSPCPSGLFCFNGICAIGCQTNANCAADQYCDNGEFGDRLCHNKTVSTCPSTPCAASQTCVNGLCSTPPVSTKCDPSQVLNGNDGCDKNSVCLQEGASESAAAKCYTFPACPEKGACPVGTIGALCNDGYIPNKARVCLTNLCKDVSNCPSSWKCVRLGASSPLGECSNGATGMPCMSPSDCVSNNCMQSMPGYPGMCM